ncbi:MAG: hypothetical protein IJL71_00255 [Oscillospiraceae bacterium]|nr:hypothetical protein [Oscillospiraceae bacterium]
MEEYKTLRQEMLLRMENRRNYNIVLYTVTAALLTFALNANEAMICLVPIIIIVPLFLMSEKQRRDICKQGAYLIVFFDDIVKWERRNHEFEVENKSKRDFFTVFIYYSVVLICSLASFYKCQIQECTDVERKVRYLIIATVLIVSMIIMGINSLNFTKERQKYIELWEKRKQKESENTNTQKATKQPQM